MNYIIGNIRKKMKNDKRSASAWLGYDVSGIMFGVTDYDPCLGYIDDDENGKKKKKRRKK